MNNEDIEKMFNLEIREKKRIGSNIYKRVSTRKGGTNMSSMRVPSQKEQKKLSGEMEVFNLNDFVPYDELLKKSESDQVLLLTHWREKHTNKEIAEGIGIDNNRLYRLMVKLGVITPKREYLSKKEELTNDKLNLLIVDKDKLYDYNKFKRLVLWQQNLLLDEYTSRYDGAISKLTDHWENANSGFLYNIRSVYKKRKSENDIVKPVTDDIKVESTKEEKTPNHLIEEKDVHEVNITMNTNKENNFSFNLNGQYTGDSIIRRLKLLMLELEETEDILKVNLSIEG